MQKVTQHDLRRRIAKISTQFTIVIILLVICILASCITPAFLGRKNLINIVRQISFTAVIAFGSTFVLTVGGIDLSPGSIVSLVSVVSAMASRAGLPVWLCVLVGIGAGALCGLINGALIATAKIPPFIVTMGMMTVAAGIALLISDGRPINGLQSSFTVIGAGTLLNIPVPVYILVLIMCVCHIVLNHTVFGRHVKAVGSSEHAAMMSGINVSLVKVMTFTIAGGLAGLSSIMLTARLHSGQPMAGDGMQMDAIAAAVIGGTSLKGGVGTIFGTICGALIIGVINNMMDLMNINMYWQDIVKGVIIVGAVILDARKYARRTA